MKGKVCLVTGATAGIGTVTARELARQGAKVVIVGRDPAKSAATLDAIKRDSGNDDVHLLLGDLSSQADIRRMAAEYRSRWDRLHVLVNNAGAVIGERRTTVDGYELTFALNHLAYFLLTNLLIDVIKASAPARIVSVSSEAHRSAKLDFDDLMHEKRSYMQLPVYSASKLANVAWSAELSRRLAGTGVTSNSLHPGVISSNFGDSGSAWMRFGVKLIRPFMITTEKGAQTSIYLASSPEVEGETGQYWSKKKSVKPNAQARDPETGKRLWAISEELCARTAASAAA